MVYLLHFTPRYKHAGHYIGSTKDLMRRLKEHREGRAARLTSVVIANGGFWRLARVWDTPPEGDWSLEKRLKAMGGAKRICPICKRGE